MRVGSVSTFVTSAAAFLAGGSAFFTSSVASPQRPFQSAPGSTMHEDAITNVVKLDVDVDAAARCAADRIALLFEHHSESQYIGEPVSILEHSWQSYLLAEKADVPFDVQIACLLHDVGHLLGSEAGHEPGMDGCGTPNHEAVGGEFLKKLGVSEYVAWLVSNHVNAKRFLVWQDPNYPLTEASRTTLRFQGGPFTDDEAAAFVERPGHEAVVRMRAFDEGAKEVGLPKPSVSDIRELVYRHVKEALREGTGSLPEESSNVPSYRLSSEQLRFFDESGYLVVRGLLARHRGKSLSELAETIVSDPPPKALARDEKVSLPSNEGQIQRCQAENFVEASSEWRSISNVARDICGELFGEQAVLVKDRIDFKCPGGGGFLPRQNVPTYKPDEFALTCISVSVAIDPVLDATMGPLEIAPRKHKQGIFPNVKGVIANKTVNSMHFVPVYLEKGDVLFFSSYVPRRSSPNESDECHRYVHLTYNKLSGGGGGGMERNGVMIAS